MKQACRYLIGASALAGLLCAAPARACSAPTEESIFNVSDVVFDAWADCNQEQRSCRLRVYRVVKNPGHLALERRPIEVDFQYRPGVLFETNPGTLIIYCGAETFEPKEKRFRARFYANLDEDSSELIVRHARDLDDNSSTQE